MPPRVSYKKYGEFHKLDWKNEKDYEFTADLGSEGWCWQFMRRNKDYQDQFAQSKSAADYVYDPPKMKGETDSEYFQRTLNHPHEPRSWPLTTVYAIRWGLKPPMPNPNCNKTPEFLLEYPSIPSWEDINRYFGEDDDVGPTVQQSPYLTLTFNISEPIEPQLHQAKAFLDLHSIAKPYPKSANIFEIKWNTYLRLLDAIEAGDLASNSWSRSKVVKSHMRRSEPCPRNDTTPKRSFTSFVQPMSC